MILSEAILFACWVAMAAWHAHLIKAARPIKHGWWGLLAGGLIAAATIVYAPGRPWWQIGLFGATQGDLRLVAFNVSLNLFRGLPWSYTSKTTTSIIDQLELRLFGGRAWIVEIILAALFIITQFFL